MRSPSHLFASAALGALLWLVVGRCRYVVRCRREAAPRAIPEPLQVWEGEGGQNQMPESPPAA